MNKDTLSDDQLDRRRGTINSAAGLRLLNAAYDFSVSFSDEFGALDEEPFRRGMLLSRMPRSHHTRSETDVSTLPDQRIR